MAFVVAIFFPSGRLREEGSWCAKPVEAFLSQPLMKQHRLQLSNVPAVVDGDVKMHKILRLCAVEKQLPVLMVHSILLPYHNFALQPNMA